MDTLTSKERSERMRLIRPKNTKIELRVRRVVHGLGYRYRLHDRRVPGSPDLVFRGRRKVIFVHGCFFHGHTCKFGRMPKSRVDFWSQKIAANRARDARVLENIVAMGWSALVIWECQLGNNESLERVVRGFLDA